MIRRVLDGSKPDHCKLRIEARVDAKFELRRASTAGCTHAAGYGCEFVWDATVAG